MINRGKECFESWIVEIGSSTDGTNLFGGTLFEWRGGGRGGGRGGSSGGGRGTSQTSPALPIKSPAQLQVAAEEKTRKEQLQLAEESKQAQKTKEAEETAKLNAMATEDRNKILAEKAKQEALLVEQKEAAERIAKEKADFIKQQRLTLLESDKASLKTALIDVKNPNQFNRITATLLKVQQNRMCVPGGKDKELIDQAKAMLKKLEHMQLLKKAIAQLNQKTIAEIRSFDQPKSEIIDVMKVTFLLLGIPAKELKEWKQIRGLIGKMGKQSLKRKINDFTIAAGKELPKKIIREATSLNKTVDVGRVAEISQGASSFFACK